MPTLHSVLLDLHTSPTLPVISFPPDSLSFCSKLSAPWSTVSPVLFLYALGSPFFALWSLPFCTSFPFSLVPLTLLPVCPLPSSVFSCGLTSHPPPLCSCCPCPPDSTHSDYDITLSSLQSSLSSDLLYSLCPHPILSSLDSAPPWDLLSSLCPPHSFDFSYF